MVRDSLLEGVHQVVVVCEIIANHHTTLGYWLKALFAFVVGYDWVGSSRIV